MDLIPLADPVRIKTIPRDDPSAEAGLAGALAAFLSVLGGNAGDTPTPDGSSRPTGARIDAAVASKTAIPFFDDTAAPTADPEETAAGPAPMAGPPDRAVLPVPALPGAVDGASDAATAMDAPDLRNTTTVDTSPTDAGAGEQPVADAPARRSVMPGPLPESGAILSARDGVAGEMRASGADSRGATPEARSAVTSDTGAAQAAMPRVEVPEARRPGTQGRDAGRSPEPTDDGGGERASAGYTVSRTEPGRGAPVTPQDPGARGAENPLPAAADGPQVPAGNGATTAPGLRPVAVPTTSAAAESVAATHRPFVATETAGVGSAASQSQPAPPESRPLGTRTASDPVGFALPAASAVADKAGRATDGASPVRAGREDAAAPLAAPAGAASPTVAAGHGAAQTADSVAPLPTATDAEPADLLAEPGDPLAATADAAPAARGADRAAAGHPLTGALPAGLGHRLAEAVSQFPDRPVEITLSPEELGRVRLTLTTHDGALTMMIQADRPETLDLLRRNIDSLAQDFRDLGYQDLTFSFGQERNPRQSPDAGPLIAVAETDAPPAPAAIGAPGHDRTRLVADGGGLDLRL